MLARHADLLRHSSNWRVKVWPHVGFPMARGMNGPFSFCEPEVFLFLLKLLRAPGACWRGPGGSTQVLFLLLLSFLPPSSYTSVGWLVSTGIGYCECSLSSFVHWETHWRTFTTIAVGCFTFHFMALCLVTLMKGFYNSWFH